MTFDSREFLIFFALVYAAWLLVRNFDRPIRNGFLLIASYIFYGFWNPAFVILILISTLLDYYLGRAISASDVDKTRKQFVAISVIVNLSILGFFKYFNFFIDSAVMVLPEGAFIAPALEVILPVGISFYTFQSMSYSIDVYRKHVKASESLLDFALYVAFFPQLVAGPIERAGNMLKQFAGTPQMNTKRTLDGFDLILRGFFKKIVIADNIAPLVNLIYGDVDTASSLGLWVGTYAFAIQVYCDFSGYTDIARGTAKLLGYELMENFRAPYAAVNISEFWQRWHISLTTWFRDYLYVPLGGYRGNRLRQLQSLFLVMALAGLWHGAAWNFVIWGIFHGVLLVLHRLIVPVIRPITMQFGEIGTRAFRFASWLLTFKLAILSFAMFRAENVDDIASALSKMVIHPISDLMRNGFSFIPNAGSGEQLFYIILILGTLMTQFKFFQLSEDWRESTIIRASRGGMALVLMFVLYPTIKEQFIYFQF